MSDVGARSFQSGREIPAGRGKAARKIACALEPLGDGGRSPDRVANGGEIPRPTLAEGQSAARSKHVGHGAQVLAAVPADLWVLDEEADHSEAAGDLLRAGQRSGELSREQPCSGRGDGPIEGGQQGAVTPGR